LNGDEDRDASASMTGGHPMAFTISVPPHYEALGHAFVALLGRLDDEMAHARDGAALDYAAVEETIAHGLGALERAAHESLLQRLDINVPSIRVWGDEYRRVGRYEGEYHCLSGTIRVMRTVYRKKRRNGETIDPVSVRAGVVGDGWLPRTARAMAHLLAQGTSREAESTGKELARLPYSRCSFERVGHDVGELYRRAQPRIEQALIEELAVPTEARSVSISIDRVALPMEELPEKAEDFEPSPIVQEALARAAKRPPDLRLQAIRAETQRSFVEPKVLRSFRMAYVATVTLHDGQGEALHTIRYGRMPKGDVRGLCQALARDVSALRAQRPDLKVVYLADGAVELWNLFDGYLARPLGANVTKLVDFWHVTEYLSAAAVVLETRRKAWPGQFRRWREALKTEDGAAGRIADELEHSRLVDVVVDGQQPVRTALRLALAPTEFLAKLAAIVPSPRMHLVRYHGVFAPNAKDRPEVVPVPASAVEDSATQGAPRARERRLDWAALLRRVFAVDVLQCPLCNGRMKVVAFITDPLVTRRILDHLGLASPPPALGPARAPPGPGFDLDPVCDDSIG